MVPPAALLAIALLCLLLQPPAAAIILPTTWASHMVIQRSSVANTLWGLDTPGAVVTLTCTAPWCGVAGFTSTEADSTGRFEIKLPAATASTKPFTMKLSSSKDGGSLQLTDLLVGDVYVCSGQSNMGLPVMATAEQAAVLAKANTLGASLRIFSVANLPEYATTKTPQANLTASIPWSRASSMSAPGMSAFCYGFGAEAVQAHPEIPIGMQNNAWGGVAIQVYMSPAAMAQCAHVAVTPTLAERLVSGDPAFQALAAAEIGLANANRLGVDAQPETPGCLYNSMTFALFANPITGILWYQGESNAGDPLGYQCMQKAMVQDWRQSWAKVGAAPNLPFLFAQISAWPTGATGHTGQMIPIFRVAVEKTLTDLPRVGMVVSADIADPAGSYHPIHPPWKAELARRAWLWADNEIYKNTSSPLSGPRVVSATWDQWDDWGDYHHGTGSNSYVCSSKCPGATCWTCAGVRVRFDQPIKLRHFYQMDAPAATEHIYDFTKGGISGFEVWSANATDGYSDLSWWQPTALTNLVDDYTVQLNLTWIEPQNNRSRLVNSRPTPRVLKYAWHEYPSAMPIINAFGLPAGPFNITISAKATAAPAEGTRPAARRPMSIGWFDNRAGFLECEPDGGVGLNYSVLTHVTANGCGMNENNTVDCVGKLNSTTMQRLVAAAHAAGTKVLVGVDFTSKACHISHEPAACPILSPGAAQDTYLGSLVAFVRANRLDGVEVDYESFGVGSPGDLAARKLFSGLLVRLKQALTASGSREHPAVHGDELGVCLAANFNNPFIFVDPAVEGVLQAIDYYNVMSYVWSPTGNFDKAKTALSVVAAAGFPKAKINMGVAFYDHGSQDYCGLARGCTNASCTSACTAPASNTCNGKLFDGQHMQTAMGRYVATEGWGGVLIFQVNYDKDNILLNALGAGLAAGGTAPAGPGI